MLLPFALLLFAQTAPSPDPTLPPPGAISIAAVEGRGVQIYRCVPQAGSDQWEFVSPEATLFVPATGAETGSHGAGPTWTWKDGSAVLGTVLSRAKATRAEAVPWLLVATRPTGAVNGFLSTVRFVRRSDTEGGQAPAAGCDAGNLGVTLRVPYRATYTFYTPPGEPR